MSGTNLTHIESHLSSFLSPTCQALWPSPPFLLSFIQAAGQGPSALPLRSLSLRSLSLSLCKTSVTIVIMYFVIDIGSIKIMYLNKVPTEIMDQVQGQFFKPLQFPHLSTRLAGEWFIQIHFIGRSQCSCLFYSDHLYSQLFLPTERKQGP